jgi:hypothetical protein
MIRLLSVLLLAFSVNAPGAELSAYGAVCDGSNDDTVAIQAAINDVQSQRGVLDWPVGFCKISATLNISDAITIRGKGRQSSGIRWTDDALTGISIKTDRGVVIERMQFSAPMTATNGAMIKVEGDTAANVLSIFRDNTFIGGFNQIQTVSAYIWTIDTNYHYGYQNTAVIVQNTFNVDYGDSSIQNSIFSGGGPLSTSILQYSSGGLRVTNSKLLGGLNAYRLYLSAGAVTSDLIFVGNSVENQIGTALQFGTAGGNATFANIVITDNQFMNQPIVIGMDSPTRFMSRMTINDNSMSVVARYGIIGTNIEDFIISDNQISGIAGALNGIAIGSNSQNGRVSANRTKAFATGIVNNSVSVNVTP